MGKTASITLLAGSLLLGGAAAAHTADHAGPAPRAVHTHATQPRTFVPGHWEWRGPHRVWVAPYWVVAPRYAGPHGPARHPGYRPRGDRDRDGIPNRFDRDRDGDGVPNRFDRAPDQWRRH